MFIEKSSSAGLNKLCEPDLINFSIFFSFSFVCNKADPSLLDSRQHHTIILLLIYVDDLFLTGNNESKIPKLISTFASEFARKDLERLRYFVSVEACYVPGT